MNEVSEDTILKKGIRKTWFLWGAILISLYLYVRICHILERTWIPKVKADFPTSLLMLLLYIIAAVLLVLSCFFRNANMKQQSKKQEAKYIQHAVKTNFHPAIDKYNVAVLVSSSISLFIGILGLVLFILTKNFQGLYILTTISAIAIFYHRPKMKELQKVVSMMNHTKHIPNKTAAPDAHRAARP